MWLKPSTLYVLTALVIEYSHYCHEALPAEAAARHEDTGAVAPMVVLGASIVTKTGKVLVSRQFVDMTRIRIEGLLAAFPKLVSVGKQHTYVDTETVRYVYQPMEGLYLLLITNKASNIIEDLETLRLLSKVVPDYVSPIEEETIGRHAFDLLFAFDEVIAFGHKENITVSQVRQNTEMESHEEKLHRIIIQNKINETKDVMKRKANEIDKAKMESRKAGGKDMFKTMMPGPEMGMDSGMRMAGNDGDRPSFSSSRNTGASKPSRPTGAGKGMVLGKAKKTSDFLESLRAEGEAVDDAPAVRKPGARAPVASAPTPSEPVTIDMEEKLSVVCNKEGGLENLEVQGTMALQVLSEEAAHIQVQLDMGANAGLQFKTHPNIDKALYSSQSILGLKDPSRPFPTGTTLPVLKWRLQSRDEELMPISINCWPTKSGSETYVNIEYESGVDYDLQNVCIAIPGVLQAPQVNQVDGEWQFDSRQHMLLWRVDLIDDSNRSGSMEFVVPGNDSEAFFPVQVSFSSSHIIADVALASVTSAQTRAPVQFRSSRTLIADNYEVVH